ncbi:hypothetical protein VDGD_20742 [Verticillium dahliae]|nr:hypothetical protein VDGD_20742 [Verticillium dahliae]
MRNTNYLSSCACGSRAASDTMTDFSTVRPGTWPAGDGGAGRRCYTARQSCLRR